MDDVDIQDIIDESLSDCSLLSESENSPQSINIDISNGSPIDTGDLIVVHFNIDSITAEGRLEQLKVICQTMNLDVLIITESKLDDSIPNSLIEITNFHEPLRRDRNRHGGGCLIYISENLTFKQMSELQSDKYEHIWADVKVNEKIYSINALYRPSTDNTNDKYEEFLTESETLLQRLSNHRSDIKIISSDLNFGNVYSKSVILDPKPLDQTAPELYSSYGMTQLIDIPTRVREHTISLVDLFFVSSTDNVKSHGTLPAIADHDGVFASFHCIKTQTKIKSKTIFNYENADEKGLLKYLSDFNFDSEVMSKPVEEQAEIFSKILIEAREKFIPTKQITIRPQDQPWTNRFTRLLLRRKNRNYLIFKKASLKYKKCCSDSNTSEESRTRLLDKKEKAFEKSKSADEDSKKANRRSKLSFFNTINATMKNPEISAKKKFSILTKLMKTQKVSTIPPILDKDKVVTDAQAKCKIFNDYFASKASVPGNDDQVPDLAPRDDIVENLTTVNTSYIEVAKLCRDIKKSKTSHCGLPGKFISMIATPISFTLAQIFNNMFDAGIFPEIFKLAHVCPVYKRSGLKSDISNWRPISLLPTLSKIAESVMHKRLLQHFSDNNVISERQAAYLKGDGTIQQLTYIIHMIRTSWTKKNIMQGVFLDVSAAFDKAWHSGLIAKLEQVKVGGKCLDLFKSYLSERRQIVTIDGCKSEIKYLKAGVPQGSRLGPLLWILYANDILDEIECNIFLFADDTCMFAEGKNPDETAEILNRDLIKISAWAQKWKVKFNPDKTKYMIFSNKDFEATPPIIFNDFAVKRVSEHKHLGIWLTPTLSWSRHVHHICMRANSKLSVLRSIKYLSRPVLDILYKQQIRSVIDYGLVLFYGGLSQSDIAKLDRIQYRSAKVVSGALHFTSRIKLDNDLGWESLADRYELLGLSLFHRIAHNNVRPLIRSLLPKTKEKKYNTRSNDEYENFPRPNEKYYKSFFPHFTRSWNNLDKAIRDDQDNLNFKDNLKLKLKPPKHRHYKYGDKYINTLMCRLRVGRSYLNADSFKIGHSDTDRCECGQKETVAHFFVCRKYSAQQEILHSKFNDILPHFKNLSNAKKLETFLFGHNLTAEEFDCRNIPLTFAVQKYVLSTKRFSD